MSILVRKQSLFAVLAALALTLALALGTFTSAANAQGEGNPPEVECAAEGATFSGFKAEGQGPFTGTVTIDGTTVTISGTISGNDLTFTTSPETELVVVVKAGQNTVSFTSSGGTFTDVIGQDISHVTFCVPAGGTTTGTTTGTTGTTTAVTTTGTTTGTTTAQPPIIVKKPPKVIVKKKPHVIVKKKGVVVAKGTATPTATVTATAKTATATATATKTATATATKTATATPTATVTASTKTATAASAQYKQYATATALPDTGGSGPVVPIAVGALLLVLGSGIMVLRMARSSS